LCLKEAVILKPETGKELPSKRVKQSLIQAFPDLWIRFSDTSSDPDSAAGKRDVSHVN
jgi:hypothetical protein